MFWNTCWIIIGWTRVQCFGHRLNLAVVNAIKDNAGVISAIESCKKACLHFAHSHKKMRLLEDAQEQLTLPKHHLIQDCPTRWGSSYAMIERFLEQEPAIRLVLSNNRKATHLIPTGDDLAALESVRLALQPVAPFTDMLSGKHIVGNIDKDSVNVCKL